MKQTDDPSGLTAKLLQLDVQGDSRASINRVEAVARSSCAIDIFQGGFPSERRAELKKQGAMYPRSEEVRAARTSHVIRGSSRQVKSVLETSHQHGHL